jgi:hypothetical protein
MTAPAGTAIAAGSALTQDEPWTRLSLLRGWANAGNGVAGADYDKVRALHLPRPQLYPDAVNGDQMLGELQDVRSTRRVAATQDDREIRHRQVIYEESLDGTNRVRLAGASQRVALPLHGRVHITATFAHRVWISGAYGGPITGTDPVAYFSLFWGVPNATPKELQGSKRYTNRFTPGAASPVVDNFLTPSLTLCTIYGVLDTNGAAGLAPTTSDIEIFVAFTAPASTLFGGGRFTTTKNRDRVDVLNTSLVVRVYKNSVL